MGKKLKIIAITLIIIIIFASFFTFVNKDLNRHKESNFSINSFEDCREIVLLKATPNSIIRTFETVFLEYTIRLVEERTLAYFLSKGRITMAYDVQALPLIKSSKDKFYFYPIYNDKVVILQDFQQINSAIMSWEDLKSIDHKLSLPSDKLELQYICSAISYESIGEVNHDYTYKYLKEINEQKRLYIDDPNTPLQIRLKSTTLSQISSRDSYKIVENEDPSLVYQLGILSWDPIPEEKIKEIQNSYISLEEKLAKENLDKLNELASEQEHFFSPEMIEQFISSNEITTKFNRNVLGIQKFVPIDDIEHHLFSLILIIIIVVWIKHSQKHIIYSGIRVGLLITGILIISWLILTIFKSAIYDNPLVERISWYLYYGFMLPIPVISLYIAENADRPMDRYISNGVKLSSIISILFLLLVFTNDKHQLVFKFHSLDQRTWNSQYSYGIGYISLKLWFIISLFAAFFLMMKKAWDSPKRKNILIPMLVILLGILYSSLYNSRVQFFSELPLTFGMSIFIIGFWAAAIFFDLIPVNKSYPLTFEESTMDMQILDLKSNIIHKTKGATPISEEMEKAIIERDKEVFVYKDNILVSTTAISGGKVIIKEDISIINELKNSLEKVTEELEKENNILLKKEKIERELVFVRERNYILEEVSKIINEKTREMKNLLEGIEETELIKDKVRKEIYRLAIYSKRKSELLIKSQQEKTYSMEDTSNLLEEITKEMPKGYTFFSRPKGEVSLDTVKILYDYYHQALNIGVGIGTQNITTRLYKENKKTYLHLLVDENGNRIYIELKDFLSNRLSTKIRKKSIDSSTSIILSIEEGVEDYDGII